MISYIGGKARIGKWIVPHIPNDIETYVEGFSGMFWVFFNMDLSRYPNLKTVVYNDYNELNYNLLQWCKIPHRFHVELSKYPCQQLNVVDTPKEYKKMFNQQIKRINNIIRIESTKLNTMCKIHMYGKKFYFDIEKPYKTEEYDKYYKET